MFQSFWKRNAVILSHCFNGLRDQLLSKKAKSGSSKKKTNHRLLLKFKLFRFVSVFDFVNLKLDVHEWQIIRVELESSIVKVLLQTCCLKNRLLYNALELRNTNVLPLFFFVTFTKAMKSSNLQPPRQHEGNAFFHLFRGLAGAR